MESSIEQPEPVNPRKRKRAHNGRTRIEIPLPSKPRDYIPGSGPPLQRISILPPKDSTAYIIEKLFLPSPGLAADGKPLPKRMTYMVGWHDLPAARMLVPAMQILDYVSPRELEEWEWEVMEELDREKAELEEEQQVAMKNTAPGQQQEKKKRHGRPPKHSKIETAVVAVPESETNALPKKGVMSLTTPTKKRLEEFESLSDEEGSPSRQLRGDMLRLRESVFDLDSTDQGVDEEVDREDSEDLRESIQFDGFQEAGLETRGPRIAGKHVFEESGPSTATSTRRSTPKPAAASPALEAKRKEFAAISKKSSGLSAVVNGSLQNSISESDWAWTPVGEPASYSTSEVGTPLPESETETARLMAEARAMQKRSQESAKKPKKTTSKSKSAPPPEEPAGDEQPEGDGQPAWEVKRVEGMELYEVEGVGAVRYFKIRWEGDWPPDQNPSWEPEDNLPANLVRNYLKRSKKRRAAAKASPAPATKKRKTPLKKTPLKQTTLSWGIPARQYKSVSEAFAGDEEEAVDVEMDMEEDGVAGEGEDEGDELFVVEEEQPPPAKKSRLKASWNGGSAAGMDFGMMPIFR
ncbi:hypothetical protein ACJ41O_007691 [Fusarium nematophilum]